MKLINYLETVDFEYSMLHLQTGEAAMPVAFVTLEAGWGKVDTQISVRSASHSSNVNAHSSLKK